MSYPRPFGVFLFPSFGITAQRGIPSVHFIQEFVSLIVLNGPVKNGLHWLTFPFGQGAKDRLGAGGMRMLGFSAVVFIGSKTILPQKRNKNVYKTVFADAAPLRRQLSAHLQGCPAAAKAIWFMRVAVPKGRMPPDMSLKKNGGSGPGFPAGPAGWTHASAIVPDSADSNGRGGAHQEAQGACSGRAGR